jgi:spore coat polysaccharide biosynthesis predicted glycosyltransferase SpsG
MYAVCVESSHQRGMGHFFRALNFVEVLAQENEAYLFLINQHDPAINLLRAKGIPFEVYDTEKEGWQLDVIHKHQVNVWLDDRFSTSREHAQIIKQENVRLITIDDRGEGADFADLHFASLMFGPEFSQKRNAHQGPEFLILNKEIDKYKRLRTKSDKILLTLGGSDTYGVTVKLAKLLHDLKKEVTILIGPGFQHHTELEKAKGSFPVITSAPSLMEFFQPFDLAITGGGVTPFEANASGLPCIVVANEDFEVPVGKYLEKQGGAVFAGHHSKLLLDVFKRELDITTMSRKGLETFSTQGANNILRKVQAL